MDISNIKLIRVEKYRERKRGALPWSGGLGAASGATAAGAAYGPAGAVSNLLGLSSMLQGVALLAVIGGVAATGWQLGKIASARVSSSDENKAGASPFALWEHRKPSGAPGDAESAGTRRSSIGLATMDGLTPQERAKKAAEAAEAQRLADEEAAKKEAAAAALEVDAVDPAAQFAAAHANGGKKSVFKNSFGGLSVGAGPSSRMAGSVTRTMDASSLQKIGGGGGAAGGGGGGGSDGGAGKSAAGIGSKGKMSASRVSGQPSATNGIMGKLGAKPRHAIGQLRKAGEYASAARGIGDRETATKASGESFDNNVSPNKAIGGSGGGVASQGAGAGGGTNGSGSGAGGSSGPLSGNSGGNSNSGSQYCGQGQAVFADGTCGNIATPNGTAMMTPWQPLVDLAKKLLMAISVLGILVLLFGKVVPWGAAFAHICRRAMAVLGLIVTGLGMAIMAMGETMQGGILTALGAIIAIISISEDMKASKKELLEKEALKKANAEKIISDGFNKSAESMKALGEKSSQTFTDSLNINPNNLSGNVTPNIAENIPAKIPTVRLAPMEFLDAGSHVSLSSPLPPTPPFS